MRETTTKTTTLDGEPLIAVLQKLDDHKFRATMACVCKTWQACVKSSWDSVHFCFDSMETLEARLSWLSSQLDNPLVLHSLELHSSKPTPAFVMAMLITETLCAYGSRIRHMQAASRAWRPHP